MFLMRFSCGQVELKFKIIIEKFFSLNLKKIYIKKKATLYRGDKKIKKF